VKTDTLTLIGSGIANSVTTIPAVTDIPVDNTTQTVGLFVGILTAIVQLIQIFKKRKHNNGTN
jgi:hypothetical protein